MSIIDAINKNLKKTKIIKEYLVTYDLVFVININSKGWILEKICNIIAENGNKHCALIFTERNDKLTFALPVARGYFFAHYNLYVAAMANEPMVASALRFVWFTHPAPGRYTMDEIASALKLVTVAFTANTHHADMLQNLGVPREKIATILGGADPDIFRYKPRESGRVAFISAYYPRKNPDLMMDVIRRMPDTRFVLLGPSPDEVENAGLLWSSWQRYDELKSLKNLRIIEARYEDFASHLEGQDVYVSLSSLEGGPIPLIEALFSNMIPVVTKTGFAEDIIVDGQNGHLLELDCIVDSVVEKIRLAQTDTTTDVRSPLLKLSWANFGQSFWNYIFPNLTPDSSVTFSDPQNVRRYCREGFGNKESNGVLLVSDRGILVIPIADISADHTLLIKFRVKQLPPDSQCRVEISLDGTKIGSRSFDPNKQHEMVCKIPDYVQEKESITLTIKAKISDGRIASDSIFRLDEIQIRR